MSSTLVQEVINVSYTPTQFPAGTGAIAKITATFTGQAAGNTTPVVASVNPGDPSVTVPLAPDTYSWTLVNEDAAGNILGGSFSGSGVVAAPANVELNLATGLAFT